MKDAQIQPNRIPSHDASARQRTASDPLISSWVNASAGSGKTKVLTDRMLRLLLPRENGDKGTLPDKILALTFTKAGANEMALRLSKRLANWAILDDASLAADMEKNLLGRTPTAAELAESRKLFARVVDAPGGLNIMTIHSFCQSVLGRFPIEADLPPNFVPLEESESRELLDQARRTVLARARVATNAPLANAVHHLGQVMNEDQLTALLVSLNGERYQMQTLLNQNFGIDGLYANICVFLGIDQGQDAEKLAQDFYGTDPALDIRTLCTALTAGKSDKDATKADILQAYAQSGIETRASLFPDYREIFLTKDGGVRKALLSKTVTTQHPELLDAMMAEAVRLQTFENRQKSIVCAVLTRDSLLFGQEVLVEYQRLKDLYGALDFEDLILRTLALLKGQTIQGSVQDDVAPWIMYKLDEGLEHILVDEAQDTNPEQWEIIQLLSDEFFSGSGAHDHVRTMFVVGDEKQSIFSFQRAAPAKFRDMFKWYEKRIRESGQIFTPVPINTSFRSVQIILDTVDAVFANPSTNAALSNDYINHLAFRDGQAGLIELWPLFRNKDEDAEKPSEITGWDIPVTVLESQSGAAQMANKIGDMVQKWIDEKIILESYNRPIEAGDILILVKSRSAFVPQLVRALKLRHVPVSGVDRMILAEQLVVEDLCAGAAFALLPEDDLTLAAFLKSPFIGYDEQTLYDLAQGRNHETLWNRVRQSGDSVVIEWLNSLIEQASTDHPYEFFSRLVQAPCPADPSSGLHAIKRRLGEDAIDPLDEFLNLALDFERKHTASLQSFLKWHENGQSEIKRQLEEGSGTVRIMTVHGSKGLQAPIVFLPDTVRSGASTKQDRVLWPHKTGLPLPLIYASKTDAPKALEPAFQTIRQQEDEEYRRLLYVAMTRAEERLYIGGYTGKRMPSEDSETAYWYDDIRAAFERLPEIEQIPSGVLGDKGEDQPILRLSAPRTAAPDKDRTGKKRKEQQEEIILPSYFRRNAPTEPFPPQPLVPSKPSDPEPAATSPLSVADPFRFRRGTVTHRLLQTLPELPPEQRRVAAEKFVARAGLTLPPEMQKSIVEETLAVLEHPVFAPIFGPGSMAEIPVTGYLDEGTLISGQIDRLLVTDSEILIIDFKTNRPPPQNEADIQPVYQKQMQAYARALRKIYPGKTIRCALLWTDGPRLMEITS